MRCDIIKALSFLFIPHLRVNVPVFFSIACSEKIFRIEIVKKLSLFGKSKTNESRANMR